MVGGVGATHAGNTELAASPGAVCGLHDPLSDGNATGDDGMTGDRRQATGGLQDAQRLGWCGRVAQMSSSGNGTRVSGKAKKGSCKKLSWTVVVQMGRNRRA